MPDAAAGRFFAPFDAVVLDRLAGNAGRVEAVIFFLLVANPGHLAQEVPMSGAGMSLSGPMMS